MNYLRTTFTMDPFIKVLRSLLRPNVSPTTYESADWKTLEPLTASSSKVLDGMRQMMDAYLAGGMEKVINPTTGAKETVYKINGLADFKERAGDLLVAEGLATPADFKDDRIENVLSNARLQLIFTTYIEQVQTFADWQMRVTDQRTLNRWPAARFFRRPGAERFRDRHVAAEGQVRRYDDFEFWLFQNAADIGGFEVPWGPFGFNSYMTQQPVRRDEAERLGLARPGEVIVPPDLTRFGVSPPKQSNAGAGASVDDMPPQIRREAQKLIVAHLGPQALDANGNVTLEALKRARNL
jgi:hypothetical protein